MTICRRDNPETQDNNNDTDFLPTERYSVQLVLQPQYDERATFVGVLEATLVVAVFLPALQLCPM